MKVTMKKLRGFARHRQPGPGREFRDRRDPSSRARLNELSKAYQDMQEIRNCYENLLSASAAAASSAYEFAESLGDLGACLLMKTGLYDNEESGKVILMLGKLQFELQKIVDSYRAYIFQTITLPSESLLNELKTVEEMKRHCDEKRDAFEHTVVRYRGNPMNKQHLQAAHDDYEDHAARFVFRLKSLKEGQPCSLLTQVTRHHAAQLWLFKKGLKFLEEVDPHVKKIALEQHIDYHFRGLDDDCANDGNDPYDDEDEDDKTSGSDEFYAKQHDEAPVSRNVNEFEPRNFTTPQVEPWQKSKNLSTGKIVNTISQSAPLAQETRLATDGPMQMRASISRKLNTYALPMPKNSINSKAINPGASKLFHSTPIDPKIDAKLMKESKLPNSVVEERETKSTVDSQSANFSVANWTLPHFMPGSKIPSRYAFSGPIGVQSRPYAQAASVHVVSEPPMRNSVAQSLKKSSGASSTFVSSPKISELHELPRPPGKKLPEFLVGRTGSLAPEAPKPHTFSSSVFPLPTPVQVVPRSFSTPSTGPRAKALTDINQLSHEDLSSPPLSPLHIKD